MIRKATIEDLKQLTVLFDLYRQFYKQETNLQAAEQFLLQRLQNEESVIFVAESEESSKKLQGFVQLYPSFTSIGLKRSWILNDLYVDPAARGQGIGEKLLRAAESFSSESGARNLMLQTARTNETAQRLYEKLGWMRDEKYYTYYYFH